MLSAAWGWSIGTMWPASYTCRKVRLPAPSAAEAVRARPPVVRTPSLSKDHVESSSALKASLPDQPSSFVQALLPIPAHDWVGKKEMCVCVLGGRGDISNDSINRY